ncbi:hypothetical protein [Mucilaginibacter sp. BT774]|uniref:hypothetical protein n=1 Tax=Mucilaginibacter sp. BT774 TaxID=3062276 RepID=UPI0026747B3B|nr:hypothetical protein [Mucilaginibacter sp. BT774]MDO3624854.1 hypothetical protein [Mucilaginibacter sp. BT774]
MSRSKKIKIILPIVITLFLGAYADHKHVRQKLNITGRLQDKQMDEISGIAASAIHEGIYYVHNDSGDTSRFFAITPQGNIKSVIYFKGDAKEKQGVRDCEDIAVGPGPVKGKSYVYMGDIGDNGAVRKYITIYRIEDQKSWIGTDSIIKTNAVPVHLRYPDGPRDAETLMVDPIEKLFYIVSKRTDSVSVYTSPLNFKPNDTVTLTKRCKLYFNGFRPFKWITAGDISRDGQQILLKDYVKVYYWKRNGSEPIWKTMQRKPVDLPYQQEKQGEAIGFTLDGKGYYTTSEGVFAPIYYYNVPEK